jgi:hypothetical protein
MITRWSFDSFRSSGISPDPTTRGRTIFGLADAEDAASGALELDE